MSRRLATVLSLLALAVLAAGIAVLHRQPVAVEELTVAVPAGPDETGTIDLDTALYLPDGASSADPRPAVLLAHGFLSDRTALDGQARDLAAAGYVAMTWSARGFGRSGGEIALADPDREIADVSELVALLADREEVLSDAAGDPRVALAGASYGGGIALLAAAAEPHLDAVVAIATWHSLARSLAPNGVVDGPAGVLKAGWTGLLFTSSTSRAAGGAVDPCGRFAPEVCDAYLAAASRGTLTASARAVLDRGSPAGRLDEVTVPTLLIQGQDDTLFDLRESQRNAEAIAATGTPVRLRWVPGSHGEVGVASGSDEIGGELVAWLDRWLRDGSDGEVVPFTWTDAASGVAHDRERLPASASAPLDLALTPAGTLEEAPAGQGSSGWLSLLSPPGGRPAAVSTLPGAGVLGGLLPATELPGQHVTFVSEPMLDDLTLLGAPSLGLTVAADGPEARLFVKLGDVSGEGNTRLIQQAVTPVRVTELPREVVVRLPVLSHRLPAGHRLRVTIATTDQAFANLTEPTTVQLEVGPDTRLILPTTVVTSGGGGLLAGSVALVALAAVAAVATLVMIARRRGGGPARDRSPAIEVSEAPPVVLRGLTKRYPDGQLAVDQLDLTVERQAVMGLLGPNGAGKTSALRMLLGLSHPTAGSAEVFGQRMRPGHPVLERVGTLVEGPGFVPELPGLDNLELYWRAGGRPIEEAELPWALEVADLGEAIRKPVKTYSHGMKQRLAIAQALLGRPELLVLDEPTDGLDPQQIRTMRQLLARLGHEGHTVLVSSHLLAEVEQMCTHVAVMQRGRRRASGRVADLVGRTTTVVIETDDPERARAVLESRSGTAVEPSGAGLAVELDGAEVADLVAALVDAGLRVRAVTPRGTLEDAFLSLTSDDGDGSGGAT